MINSYIFYMLANLLSASTVVAPGGPAERHPRRREKGAGRRGEEINIADRAYKCT